MSILNVIEYKEEGVAIIEDTQGKYAVTQDDPTPIDLESSYYQTLTGLERERMLT